MKIETKCSHCEKIFMIERRHFNQSMKKGYNIFCSKYCQGSLKSKSELRKCKTCGIEVKKPLRELKKSKSGYVFCSRSCSTTFTNSEYKSGENHPNYTDGKASYRRRKLREGSNYCEDCGICDIRVLEVHHKDGNRNNNKMDNLSVLCANCHLIRHYK